MAMGKITQTVNIDVEPGMILIHNAFDHGFYFITHDMKKAWIEFGVGKDISISKNLSARDMDWEGWRVADPKNLWRKP